MTYTLVHQITLIGLGLMGGSLAKALKKENIAKRIIGCSASKETLTAAKTAGAIDVAVEKPSDAVKRSDIVILCTPLHTYTPLMQEIAPSMKKSVLLSDIGSVKQPMIDACSPYIRGGVHCVPAHPIAGSEQSGFSASTEELYREKKVIFTPVANWHSKQAFETLTALWEACGAQVLTLDASEHDTVYAEISHIPQIAAYAFMHSMKADLPVFTTYKDDYFKAFTRLGGSNPLMWRDILATNQVAIKKGLKVLISALKKTEERLQSTHYDRILSDVSASHTTWRKHFDASSLEAPSRSYSGTSSLYALAVCLPRLIAENLLSSFPHYRFAGSGFYSMTCALEDLSPFQEKRLISHQASILSALSAYVAELTHIYSMLSSASLDAIMLYFQEACALHKTLLEQVSVEV